MDPGEWERQRQSMMAPYTEPGPALAAPTGDFSDWPDDLDYRAPQAAPQQQPLAPTRILPNPGQPAGDPTQTYHYPQGAGDLTNPGRPMSQPTQVSLPPEDEDSTQVGRPQRRESLRMPTMKEIFVNNKK